ncbi:hypothetical protein QQ045_030168 [Rhodiola kirilowii]
MWHLLNLIFKLLLLILPGFAFFLFRLRQWIIGDHQLLKVPEFNDHGLPNHLYKKLNTYVYSLASIEDCDSALLFTGRNQNDVVMRVEPEQPVPDTFLGARLTWTMSINKSRGRSFNLRIRRLDKRRVIRSYLAHIASVSDEIDNRSSKELKLHVNESNGCHRWRSVPFTHPTTLENIAMDVDLKNRLRADLETFAKSRNYYHRQGRVCKRSYLLYGPSGTGKSSFVAAMANLLCFDVYDIDASKLGHSSELKTLLLNTTPKSIIVLEDLDRYLMNQSSLTGLLNFMDGVLTGCCGDERVMVYTMSGEKDKIDPAILRPGRVDVHVNFPLCDFGSFKMLASSYLGVADHKLFGQVEEVFSAGARLSAAEISELMMVNRHSPKRAIKSVIGALQMDQRISGGDGGGVEEEVVVVERSGELRKLLMKVKSRAKNRWMS